MNVKLNDKIQIMFCVVLGWYDAAEVLFAMGMILLLFALVAESLFACCHLGLERPLVPVVVASLTLGAGTTVHSCAVVIQRRSTPLQSVIRASSSVPFRSVPNVLQ